MTMTLIRIYLGLEGILARGTCDLEHATYVAVVQLSSWQPSVRSVRSVGNYSI